VNVSNVSRFEELEVSKFHGFKSFQLTTADDVATWRLSNLETLNL
jgi:hypothetical protein